MISVGTTNPQTLISGTLSFVEEAFRIVPIILKPIGSKGISLNIAGVANVAIVNRLFDAYIFPITGNVVSSQYASIGVTNLNVANGAAFSLNFNFLNVSPGSSFYPTALIPNAAAVATTANTGSTSNFRYNPNLPPAAGQQESNAYADTGTISTTLPSSTIDVAESIINAIPNTPAAFPASMTASLGLEKSTAFVVADPVNIIIPDKFMIMVSSPFLNIYTGTLLYSVSSF